MHSVATQTFMLFAGASTEETLTLNFKLTESESCKESSELKLLKNRRDDKVLYFLIL